MAGEDLKVSFNPFAYQSSNASGVKFRGAEGSVRGVAQPQEGQKAFGYITRPAQKPSSEELLTEAYDKNFIKNTYAYAGANGPSLDMPESRAYYDDSDFRGKMYYAA